MDATADVVIVKLAVVAPPATVTLAGTWAATVLLLVRETTAPPGGAGAFKVAVPADEVPPMTEPGLRLTEVSAAAVTVRVAVFVAL